MMYDGEFDEEVEKFTKGETYNAEIIAEQLQVRAVAFKERDTPQNCKALADDCVKGISPLIRYIRDNETNKTAYRATYIASMDRQRVSEKNEKFWQGATVGVCAIVVVYAMIRTIMWLWPSICEIFGKWIG